MATCKRWRLGARYLNFGQRYASYIHILAVLMPLWLQMSGLYMSNGGVRVETSMRRSGPGLAADLGLIMTPPVKNGLKKWRNSFCCRDVHGIFYNPWAALQCTSMKNWPYSSLAGLGSINYWCMEKLDAGDPILSPIPYTDSRRLGLLSAVLFQ